MKSYLIKALGFAYTTLIAKKQKEINFWILYAFLTIFILSRFFIYHFPDFFLTIRGVHVHHFAYGIVLLALVCYFSLHNFHLRKPRTMGILFGVSLGLAVDEFGMWIRLDDSYWVRWSYDAFFIVGSLLISFVYFGKFWSKIIEKTSRIKLT